MLADQADAAGDALMPSYTHLRRAQPILAAHFFLAHAAAFRRDHARLRVGARRDRRAAARIRRDCRHQLRHRRAARSPRVSASAAIVANSIDATGDRDFVASFLHACALTMVHLSRLAEDLILFTSEEFGFFELADTAATGSSLMPQKKNPDPLELVRGKAGRVIGRLAGWLATMKGLPIGYSKDLQEDKEGLFEAEDTRARVARRRRVGRCAGSRSTAAVTEARRVRACCSRPTSPTTWSRRGCRSATRTRSSARWSGASSRSAASFDDLTLEEWRAHSPLFDADVRDGDHAAPPRSRRSARRNRPIPTRSRRRCRSCSGWLASGSR